MQNWAAQSKNKFFDWLENFQLGIKSKLVPKSQIS